MLTRSPVPVTSAAPSSSAAPLRGTNSGSFTVSHFCHAPESLPRSGASGPASRSASPRSIGAASSRKSSASPLTAAQRSASAAPSSAPRRSGRTARVPKYVAVDAATQYSPPDYLNPRGDEAHSVAPTSQATSQPRPEHVRSTALPAMPAPQPTVMREQHEHAPDSGSASPAASHAPPQPPSPTKSSATSLVAVPVQSFASPAGSGRKIPPIKRRGSRGLSISSASSGQGAPSATKRSKPAAPPVTTLPARYELCPTEDVVVLIANMLGELIETNDALALKPGHLTRFHSRTAPGISVLDYLHRIAKHANLTPPLLLAMVYYIDRLCALYPAFTINTLTVHRFLITAATVASKGLSDAFWKNSIYAQVGGIRLAELRVLEVEFLYRVDWKIIPNPEVMVAYYQGLVERCPGYSLEAPQEDGADAKEPQKAVEARDGKQREPDAYNGDINMAE